MRTTKSNILSTIHLKYMFFFAETRVHLSHGEKKYLKVLSLIFKTFFLIPGDRKSKIEGEKNKSPQLKFENRNSKEKKIKSGAESGQSPFHIIISSHHHIIIISSYHHVIISSYHHIIISPFNRIIISSYQHITKRKIHMPLCGEFSRSSQDLGKSSSDSHTSQDDQPNLPKSGT